MGVLLEEGMEGSFCEEVVLLLLDHFMPETSYQEVPPVEKAKIGARIQRNMIHGP